MVFKEHNAKLVAKKKGNVDTDIVFAVLRNIIEEHESHRVVLVSGDGDYKKLVDYLIQKDRFEKIFIILISCHKCMSHKIMFKVGI